MADGLQEVFCRDCGASLGWQDADTEIDPQTWTHARCPVWTANKFGITRQQYDYLLAWLSQVIAGAYPEFPHGIIGNPADAKIQKLRGEIAAGTVMEVLAIQGWTIVEKEDTHEKSTPSQSHTGPGGAPAGRDPGA